MKNEDSNSSVERMAFLEEIKKSKLINMDAPISSVFDAASKLPSDTPQYTAVYDSDKYFAIIK